MLEYKKVGILIKVLFLSHFLSYAQPELQLKNSLHHEGSKAVGSLAFSSDGNFLVTGSSGDNRIRIFNSNTSQELNSFLQDGMVQCISLSPNGEVVAARLFNPDIIYIINLHTGKRTKSFAPENWKGSLCFSPDGKLLAVCDRYKTKLLNIQTNELVKSFNHNQNANEMNESAYVSFSPNGEYLAVATETGGTFGIGHKLHIFNLQNNQEIKSWELGCVILDLAFSPDGESVAVGTPDNEKSETHEGKARIFNIKSGRETNSFVHEDWVQAVAFSSDGRYLATATGKILHIFGIQEGEQISQFDNDRSIFSVAFHPDGNLLAISGDGNEVPILSFEENIEKLALVYWKRLKEPFSTKELDNERNEKLKSIQTIRKDEFETQSEFEKRKGESVSKENSIIQEYDRKIESARKLFEIRKQELQIEFSEKLSNSKSYIESKFVLGIYDPEKGKFPITLSDVTSTEVVKKPVEDKNITYLKNKIKAFPSTENEDTPNEALTVNVPREFAREFKELAPSLKAIGQKQLNVNLEWEYFNWNISTPNGQTYSFGEQRGTNDQGIPTISTVPPRLAAKVVFFEPSLNNILDAGEEGKLTFTVTNSGNGSAFGVEGRLTSIPVIGVTTNLSFFIGEIPAGQSKTAVLNLNANSELKDGNNQFNFTFTEARGFPPDPIKITLATRAFIPPKLIIADVGVNEPSGNGRIENEEIVEVKARIQNIGQGLAKNVKGHFDLGSNVFKTQDSNTDFIIGELASGAYYDAVIKVYTNKIATELPIFITVNEGNVKYDITKARLDPNKLALNVRVQQLQEFVFKGKDGTNREISIADGLSIDIEQNLPETTIKNPNAIAVVIGIRDYASNNIPSVTYAKRDAQIMRDYLVKVLGYDPKNILPQNPDELMTVGNMKSLMRQKLPAFVKPDGSSDVFVYYTGHGAPSTTSQQPFFVPYDCDPNYVSDDNAYKMIDFYGDIQKLNAKRKTVVIDACFSGETGDGKAIIKNASPILLKVKNPLLADKNAVVFQSSESNQVSNWYPEKNHSMFTYFFLKGLKGEADLNNDRKITVDEMEKYINDENSRLPYVSRREFQRPQKAVVNGNYESVFLDIRK